MNNLEIENFYDQNNNSFELHRSILSSFFLLNVESLPREIIERYCEVSSPEMYHPIIPHTEKLIERLFSPLKSAKRCYCLSEYLATIELSAHVSEMLAVLTWEIFPISFQGKEIDEDFEIGTFGSRFEKLGQEKRVRALKAFQLINESQNKKFNLIRSRRRNYFHFWEGDFSNIKNDAYLCFVNIMQLIKEILQIGISETPPSTLSMNQHLLNYIHSHQATTS